MNINLTCIEGVSTKKLCNNENCTYCFNKSFASHKKSCYWSSNNQLTTRHVFKNSHKNYLFNCTICFHEFSVNLNNISKGQWCNYCSSKKLCENKECKLCFEKSFASQSKSSQWSSKT